MIVALSGGGDSVALLHLLRELDETGDVVLAGAAHFNHLLRPAAGEDQSFCRQLCAGLGVPLELGRGDVRAAAQTSKRSIEDTARQLRYAFLHAAAARLQADAIAVGHSRDDQAETFLLRIIRGAGTRGLGGIRPKAGMVIRPLIEISREQLRRFAADRGLAYRDDESNADLSIPRNRIRHELLPYLAGRFSPNIVEVLAREADVARDDDDRLESEAIEIARSVVLTDTQPEPVAELDAERLNALHPAIAARVARIALGHLRGAGFIGFEQVRRFLDFARSGRPGGVLSLPGQQAAHSGGRIRLEREPPRGRAIEGNHWRFPLSIPGEVVVPAGHLAVSADWANAADQAANRMSVLVTGLTGPLAVRSRKPGDRFPPPGMGGRVKKLQDYFVDRKVPRGDRDSVPLVVDRDDRIVWIVGHAVAEGFRAETPFPGVIFLKARQLGGEV